MKISRMISHRPQLQPETNNKARIMQSTLSVSSLNRLFGQLNAIATWFRLGSLSILWFIALPQARADGFRLDWAREHEAHIVMQLSPEQTALVGSQRKLHLTDSQRETLSKFTKKVPRIIGVESLGESDCSCHISSALWTATNEVTIWVERLARDPDGSKAYYEVRSKRGYYTADAEGRIYAAGKAISWEQFEKAVLAKKEDEYIQLSLPPRELKEFTTRVRRLKARMNFNHRL